MSEIRNQFSEPDRDVKAFLFVQINPDVVRCASETRLVILSTKIRKQRSYARQSRVSANFDPFSRLAKLWFETRRVSKDAFGTSRADVRCGHPRLSARSIKDATTRRTGRVRYQVMSCRAGSVQSRRLLT